MLIGECVFDPSRLVGISRERRQKERGGEERGVVTIAGLVMPYRGLIGQMDRRVTSCTFLRFRQKRAPRPDLIHSFPHSSALLSFVCA